MRKVSKIQLGKAREILAAQIPISRYLSDVLKRSLDSQGKILCPVHDEDTPSFHYDDTKQRGHCFGCHVGGTVVEIHLHIKRKEIENYSQVRAIKDLAKTYNITIPDLYFLEALPQDTRLKKSNRERFSSGNEMYYIEKLKEITKMSLQATLQQRIEISRIIDDVYLGRISSKDGYLNCRRILQIGSAF